MAEATHCDREGCGTWSRHPENHGFLTVNWVGSSRLARKDFCSWDCILRYGATKPPMEVIGND